MKRFTVCVKHLIIICLLVTTNIACLGGVNDVEPSGQSSAAPQFIPQARPSQSDEEALTLFRSIITKNIKQYTENQSVQTSPAIVVGLVTRKGEVVEAFGTRDINRVLPPDGNTLFGIGSISKVFTGLMLAEAVVNGDMSLSDKANDRLDGSTIKIDDGITLHQLVTHYSGLPSFPGNISSQDNGSKDAKTRILMPAKDYNKKNLIKCLQTDKCEPENPPGSLYRYSNLGISVLSIALQNYYGFSDFNSLTQAHITQVLNMDNTTTNIPRFLEKYKANIAQGYTVRQNNLKPVPFPYMGILAGSGGLISCANDMNKLLKALTGLSTVTLAPAVKEAERELAEIRPGLMIAYAHEVKRIMNGDKIHFKSGLTAGYSAIMLWRDNPKVGLILLANRSKFRPLMPNSIRVLKEVTQLLETM